MDGVAEIIVVGVILPYSEALVNEVWRLPDSRAASHAIFHLAVSAEMKSNSHRLYRQQTAANVFLPPFVV